MEYCDGKLVFVCLQKYQLVQWVGGHLYDLQARRMHMHTMYVYTGSESGC